MIVRRGLSGALVYVSEDAEAELRVFIKEGRSSDARQRHHQTRLLVR